MHRRTFIQASAAALMLTPRAASARDLPDAENANGAATGLVWRPALNGHTDTVPDIVGRLGSRIDLAIFTEGNHFPALLR